MSQRLITTVLITNFVWTLLLTGGLWYSATDALSNLKWLGHMVYARSADDAGISQKFEIGLGSRSGREGVCVWRISPTPLDIEGKLSPAPLTPPASYRTKNIRYDP